MKAVQYFEPRWFFEMSVPTLLCQKNLQAHKRTTSILFQAMQQSFTNVPGNTGTVIYKGGPSYSNVGNNMDTGRGPLPQPMNGEDDDDAFPPPPPMRVNGSADNSLNDSNSTTQSNVTSECSEAECDREPLVKSSNSNRGNLLEINKDEEDK